MTWVEVHSVFIEYANAPLPIGYEFLTSHLIITAASPQFPNKSYKVGVFKALAQVPGVGPVAVLAKTVYLGNRLLEIPLLISSSYSGEFYPFNYVRNLTLRFWEYAGNLDDIKAILTRIENRIILMGAGPSTSSPYRSKSTFNSPSNSSFTGLV